MLALIEEAHRRATPVAQRSRVHGPKHWRDVAHLGECLIAEGVPADPLVVAAFAAIHDTQRLDDWEDPNHGPRAAQIATYMRQDGWLDHLDDQQFGKLSVALAIHTGGGPQTDATIGACLDADRLTLARVGIKPDFRMMSFSHWLNERQMRALRDYGTRVAYAW